MSALTDDIPFGPFEGSPVRVYTTGSRNGRLHADPACSPLRGAKVVEATMPLEAATVRRMCSGCAEWGLWTKPTTALGVFLRALTGVGLIYELGSYSRGYADDDLAGRDLTRAAELLAAGDWPDDDDDAGLWDEYEAARDLRDDVLLPYWCGAAESLHAAYEVINRYQWLHEWAGPRIREKASYVEELRELFARVIVPANLVDAAAVSLMPEPNLASNREELAVLGDVDAALKRLWREWQREAAASSHRLEDSTSPVYRTIEKAMGRKRKGRSEADRALTDLVNEWITAARAVRNPDTTAVVQWVIATIPATDKWRARTDSRDRGFQDLLSAWDIGVLGAYATVFDWNSRLALLRVPGLVGQRLLEGDTGLRCVEVEEPASPALALAEWIELHIPTPGPGLLPGVLDDGPVSERRLVTSEAVETLRATEAGHQPYLAYSVTGGVEVLSLDTVAARTAAGWRGVVLAGAADLPENLVGPWIEEVMASVVDDDGETDDSLGVEAGERQLVGFGRGDRRRVEQHLRMLAVVRVAPDLRSVESTDYDSPQSVPYAVWSALLSPMQLDVTPFLAPGVESPRLRTGLGLPLSVLAPVQLYTTNLDPTYGKGHSPYCSHSRGRHFVGANHDLFTLADLVRKPDFDWCSKCGGYAVRRLNDAQLTYYRLAGALLDVRERINGWERSLGYRELDRDHVAELVSKLDELEKRQPDEEARRYDSDSERWRQAVSEVRDEALRLLKNDRV